MTLSVNQLFQCRMIGLLLNNDLEGMCNKLSNLKCCLRICPEGRRNAATFLSSTSAFATEKEDGLVRASCCVSLVLSKRNTMVQIEGSGVWATQSGRRESVGLTGTSKWVLRTRSLVHTEFVCVGRFTSVDCGVWYRGRERKCSSGLYLQYPTP
jgi:hypothetical protein